jgi:hypothetical protein
MLCHIPETAANATACGHESIHEGPGASPQVCGVMVAACGSHAVGGPSIDRSVVSAVYGAHSMVEKVGPTMLAHAPVR